MRFFIVGGFNRVIRKTAVETYLLITSTALLYLMQCDPCRTLGQFEPTANFSELVYMHHYIS